MKTIEERAAAYRAVRHRAQCVGDDIENAYKQGATEQQAMDIGKACKWLKKFGVFSMLSFNDEEGVSQEVYEDMFRKVMEG